MNKISGRNHEWLPEICAEAKSLNHLERSNSDNHLQQQNSTKGGGMCVTQGAPVKQPKGWLKNSHIWWKVFTYIFKVNKFQVGQPQRLTPRHIIVKMIKSRQRKFWNHQEKNVMDVVMYKGPLVRLAADFSSETTEARRPLSWFSNAMPINKS